MLSLANKFTCLPSEVASRIFFSELVDWSLVDMDFEVHVLEALDCGSE